MQGHRPYRHRHKFRFEWVASQGVPWFQQPYANDQGWDPEQADRLDDIYRSRKPVKVEKKLDRDCDKMRDIKPNHEPPQPHSKVPVRMAIFSLPNPPQVDAVVPFGRKRWKGGRKSRSASRMPLKTSESERKERARTLGPAPPAPAEPSGELCRPNIRMQRIDAAPIAPAAFGRR